MAVQRRRTARSPPTSQQHETKSLLRFITCGSVDDGKSTLIGACCTTPKLRADGPAGRAGIRQPALRHAERRRDRFRPAGRRPRRRARAGHHHRRRLPLLRHRHGASSSSPTARPRAVHPQHGDRRLDRRPRRGAGRRAQGPAHADAPAQLLHRLAARHPPRRAGGEQDGPGRLREARLRRDRRGPTANRAAKLASPR